VFDHFTQLVADASGWAYAIVFLLAVLDVFLPIVPSETAVITAGVVAGSGDLSLPIVIAAAAAGAFLGDNSMYLVGRRFGHRATDRFFSKGKGAERLDSQGRDAVRFPNALATMWTWVTEDPREADRVLREVLAPLLRREPDDLRDARRSRRTDDDLAAVLLLEPQRLFERVLVGFVHLETGVLLADPGPGVVEARLPLARRDLLDADGDLHAVNLLNRSAALVPPKPNEFDSA